MSRPSADAPLACALSFVALACAAGPPALLASDGALDPTFGSGGAYEIGWNYGGSNDDFLRAVTADDGGNLYAVGYLTSEATDFDWGIARVAADGSLLRLRLFFDAGGTNDDEATAVALDGAAAILVAGTVATADSTDLRLCRLATADLSLDPGFGSGGCAGYGLGPGEHFYPRVLARAADHGILVAGTIVQPGTYGDPNPDFFVLKFTANGGLDSSFGLFGIRVVSFDRSVNGDDELSGMAVDHQDRILLTGTVQWAADASVTRAGVARLTPAGNLDVGFGYLGVFEFAAYPNDSTRGLAIAVDPAADSFEVSGAYNPSGSEWTGYLYFFGADGGVTWWAQMDWADPDHTDYARSVLRQCDGKILVAGDGEVGETYFASRLLADGTSLDGTFGGNGDTAYTPYHLGFYLGRGVASAALSDGRLVLGGDMYWGNRDWLLVRFQSGLMFCDGFDSGGPGKWSNFVP